MHNDLPERSETTASYAPVLVGPYALKGGCVGQMSGPHVGTDARRKPDTNHTGTRRA